MSDGDERGEKRMKVFSLSFSFSSIAFERQDDNSRSKREDDHATFRGRAGWRVCQGDDARATHEGLLIRDLYRGRHLQTLCQALLSEVSSPPPSPPSSSLSLRVVLTNRFALPSRLVFPGEIVEDGREKASYDVSTGTLLVV